MLIATSLTFALLASSTPTAGAAPATHAAPPLVVNVSTSIDVSPTLIKLALAEADSIWRTAGLIIVWRKAPRDGVPHPGVSESHPYMPSTLRVIIGDEASASHDGRLPLGWIVFDDAHTPAPVIYVSRANAMRLMEESRLIVGLVSRMPIAERETYLGRAMGRAIAHEMGHYLLASKVHTAGGLMQASRTAAEFFSRDSTRFDIDPAQRQVVADRLRGDLRVARVDSQWLEVDSR